MMRRKNKGILDRQELPVMANSLTERDLAKTCIRGMSNTTLAEKLSRFFTL